MTRQQQQGLSMIELLVALALSSFLILGITQIYLDNKRSYMFQQNQAMNLDSARFSDHILTELLGKAGYLRTNAQTLDNFPASTALGTHCEAFGAGHAVTRLKDNQPGLCLRYQPAVDGELGCAGFSHTLANKNAFTAPASSEIIHIALKFVADDANLQNGVIQCVDASGTADLINGVADLRIEFGVGKKEPEKSLLDSSPWKLPAAWAAGQGPVRAVRYSVLLASAPNQRDGDSAVFTHWINTLVSSDERKTLLQSQDKRRIYQIATGSQALRNLSL